jgi:beta-phosphoglucomutase-like phosphatase (HAD superfamily)
VHVSSTSRGSSPTAPSSRPGAWSEIFDAFLLRLTEKTGWHFIPFDRDADYRAYIDGRSRLEGVHALLDSRGIRLPEGTLDDSAQAETARGLAKRKGEALARRLGERGVTAVPGARRHLEAAGRAGLKPTVVSSSASTSAMLELAGLAPLIEERIDAEIIYGEGLRSRPAPDLLLVACRRLGVRPDEAVTFTHSARRCRRRACGRTRRDGRRRRGTTRTSTGLWRETSCVLVERAARPQLSDGQDSPGAYTANRPSRA